MFIFSWATSDKAEDIKTSPESSKLKYLNNKNRNNLHAQTTNLSGAVAEDRKALLVALPSGLRSRVRDRWFSESWFGYPSRSQGAGTMVYFASAASFETTGSPWLFQNFS